MEAPKKPAAKKTTAQETARSADQSPNAMRPSVRWANRVKHLSLAGRRLRRLLAQRTEVRSLSDTEFLVMLACSEAPHGELSQNDLAQSLGISAAQVSVLVESLRTRELLDRRRCSSDRRRQLWTLTEQGSRELQQVLHELDQLLDQHPPSWDSRQQAELTAMLQQLADALERPVGEQQPLPATARGPESARANAAGSPVQDRKAA